MPIRACLLLLAMAWSVPAFAFDLECNLQSTSYILFKQAREVLKEQVGQSPASINTNEQCQAAIEGVSHDQLRAMYAPVLSAGGLK